jgi:hypothetical protein
LLRRREWGAAGAHGIESRWNYAGRCLSTRFHLLGQPATREQYVDELCREIEQTTPLLRPLAMIVVVLLAIPG